MSLGSAMNNALSGLTASARGAEVISSNLANATNASYAPQAVDLGTNAVGGGVKILSVSRQVDLGLQGAINLGLASQSAAAVQVEAATTVAKAYGTPGETGSLSSYLEQLDSTLIAASAAPESDVRLQSVLDAASDLAKAINAGSDSIQQARLSADEAIAEDVARANDLLGQIADLNSQIVSVSSHGQSPNALLDARDQAVSSLSELIPVRSTTRDNNTVALYSTGGRILLDGNPAEIGFSSSQVMVSEMSFENGALSGLTINGKAVESAENGLGGGRLGANLALRDSVLPQAQEQLGRISEALQTSLALDAGSVIQADSTGKMAVNPAFDPSQGGELWRLREGMTALSAQSAGAAGYLGTMSESLQSGTLSSLITDGASNAARAQLRAEDQLVIQSTKLTALNAQRSGVNSDDELQTLLLTEQMYAANAQVMTAIEEMLDMLMGVLR
ncbi:flagellar hook-associated protein FlgK [Donghicola tyrosinivorans]|uniref:Flagellar hook-associated protein 1 n=1 Tax=Donghicola tyrosinivorans TaxID=1652492 RepID=A0A2T0WY28_9RHOB|nr:flagellar hook-associated protein FlgK [Donghicola tyrosinivorans]PRY91555.1 flagellar hook-associated protein 1 FlgK [Donghicola tyrosinivorans]